MVAAMFVRLGSARKIAETMRLSLQISEGGFLPAKCSYIYFLSICGWK